MDGNDKSRIRKYIIRAVTVLLFFSGAVLIYFGLDYIITNNTSSMTRVSFHDFYEQDKIDIFFSGTSHTIHSINAERLSENLDRSVFSLGTSSQEFIEGYYIIKEALDNYDIEHVYYEVSFSRLTMNSTVENTVYIVTDYLRSFSKKAEMIYKVFDPDKYINSFLTLRRNIDPLNLPTINKISKIVAAKNTYDYKNYTGRGNAYRFQYLGRGQWDRGEIWKESGNLTYNINSRSDNVSIERFKDIAIEYLQKIVDLCRERNVPLTLFIPPFSEIYMCTTVNYSEADSWLNEKAEEWNAEIIDLNLAKEEYLSLSLEDFVDIDHVTAEASVKIADFLTMYINEPSDDYFYKSYDERPVSKDTILAAGYTIKFITGSGEYDKSEDADGVITDLRIDVSALAYDHIPVYARMWSTKEDPDTGGYIRDEEISGKVLDEYTTEYIIPYDQYDSIFCVELYDLDSDRLMYSTVDSFDQD